MSWVAVAVAGTALVTSYMQSQSAKKATNAQIDAANQANATQQGIYNQQTMLMAPWRNAGADSVGYLSYLMGVPGYEHWQPGMDASGKPTQAPQQGGSGKKGGWNPITGFGNSAVSIGGILGGADGGLSSIGSVFGLTAHPQTGNEGETSPTAMSGGYNTPSVATQGLPKFNSPADYGFQQLPSGAQFVGPDGIVRRKH